MNQIGKIKSKVGDVIAWWMIWGFIFGNVLGVVFFVIGLESIIIAQFYMITVIAPIGVSLAWFGLVDREGVKDPHLYEKRSPA